MEEKVELCGVNLSSSYKIPLVIVKEFENESVIKGYHAYMNDWTPFLGENLSIRPEPENKTYRYTVPVTKDAQVIGHLKKWKTDWYGKTVFYFLRANPMNTASITVKGERVKFGDGQDLQISCTFLFKGEEKYIEVLKKTVQLVPFIIVCTLETLLVKYIKYQYYHWNICLSSFLPWKCFKKISRNSKFNGFICFLLFFYLRSLKAKCQSLFIRMIISAVDKDKQLAKTSILKTMMRLKKAWDAVTEQTIRNCFWKAGISLKA